VEGGISWKGAQANNPKGHCTSWPGTVAGRGRKLDVSRREERWLCQAWRHEKRALQLEDRHGGASESDQVVRLMVAWLESWVRGFALCTIRQVTRVGVERPGGTKRQSQGQCTWPPACLGVSLTLSFILVPQVLGVQPRGTQCPGHGLRWPRVPVQPGCTGLGSVGSAQTAS
jgi:hypothetical protein